MYLKTLEIQGFKSFANKLTFSFNGGFTGIVGPNGSGKSNVADAVRWVLGEQSASKLRGGSMQDVIFAGTENRKPLSFAYVAITFDNTDHALPSDFTEITVARRVYRSGESEYLINGSACRLKDVQELFYDTGIGKEGYSIIGQGQIERILSKHPEERRELFDEAAGIVKFKRSKAATIKKLEKEQENLTRINDVLSEQERQLAPLERQSEGARIYLKKREELKTLDINAYLMDMEKILHELEIVSDDIETTDSELNSVREEKRANESAYNDLQIRIDELDQKTKEVNEALVNANTTRQSLTGTIGVKTEQLKSLDNLEVQLSERLDSVEKEAARRNQEICENSGNKESLSKALEEAKIKTGEAERNLSEIQGKLRHAREASEESKERLFSLIDEETKLTADLREYKTRLEQLQIRRADLNKKSIEQASVDMEKKEELVRAEKECNNLLDEREKLIAKLDSENEKLSSWQQKEDELKRTLNEARNEYNTKYSRLEALTNIAERYEGFGNATKAVLEQGDPKVMGVVADLMRVDSKYETAIEVALGGNIQNVVTDNESTAKDMIEFLKKNRLGRVTFLPMSNVRGGLTDRYEKGLGETGAIGMADSLISCDLKYKGIYKFLLGRVMVVDNLDHANAIARKYNFSLHLVTLEGEYLNPGGSISGGAFKNKSNLLGRSRELKDLKLEVEKLKSTFEEAQRRIDDIATAVELSKDDVESLREDLHELDVNLSSAKVRYDQLKSREEEKKNASEKLNEEKNAITAEIDELIALQEEGTKKAEEISAEKESLTGADSDTSEEIERLTEEVEKEKQKYQSVQIEEAKKRSAYDFAGQNIIRLTDEIKELENERITIVEQLKEHEYDRARINSEIEEAKAAIAVSSEEIGRLELISKENSEIRDKLSTDNKEFFVKSDEINTRLGNLEKELIRLSDRKKRLTDSKDAQDAYIWDEYELTLHNCETMRDEKYDSLPALKRQISAIKDDIKALGPVNVNAIEDYKELFERHEFMTTQRDDLIEAEKTLKDLIKELDEGMRTRFAAKFEEIKVEFDKAFKELFGGGKGELSLMEDEDILEAGIRVIAQPPGKKLQNMMMLSGGEKALTAIALLFAIQNLKPSPFCLLDEIEAALDDSNVDRFAKYLKKLSDKSQFIVITHRRGTMNSADCLYGITMQEKGVSALVSVSLIEADIDREERENKKKRE